jgi:predicted kinase
VTDPRLIMLNGPPATGKSTLARRYVEEHPLALTLDIDRIRDLIGGWRQQPAAAGPLARTAALAMARVHLLAGHDVIVPQLLARPRFLEEAEGLAGSLGVAFHEIVLMDSRENAMRRLVERDGSAPSSAEINDLYDRLVALLPTRPAAKIVRSYEGEIDRTYRAVVACL